jgi:hypothetical protein
MNIKERAAYAWGRICGLFKKKKPEVEVEIKEKQEASPLEETAYEAAVPAEQCAPKEELPAEEDVVSEFAEESEEVDLSPDDIEVEIYEESDDTCGEFTADTKSDDEVSSREVLTQADDPKSSRMTEEYIAWMKAQREAADAENNSTPFETEQ